MCMVDTKETTQQWKKKKSSCKCGSAKKDRTMLADYPGEAAPTFAKSECISLNNTTNMIAETFKSEDDKKREYLRNRLRDAFYNKMEDVDYKYGIRVKGPTTMADLVKRIKAGAYTATTEEMNKDYGHSISLWYSIDWRTEPAKDNEAKLAREKVENANTTVRDAIAILDGEKALEALKAFEATEF